MRNIKDSVNLRQALCFTFILNINGGYWRRFCGFFLLLKAQYLNNVEQQGQQTNEKKTTQRGNNIVTLNLTGTDDETSQESSEEEMVMEELDRNRVDKLIKILESLSTNVSSILPLL